MGSIVLNAPLSALAAEQLLVPMDKSTFVKLKKPPGTVVVGNPSIADITLSGNLMFLHARGYGNTNIIVLDHKGNRVAEYDVSVVQDDPHGIVVFNGGKRQSYNCVDECQPTVQIGDDPGYFGSAGGQISGKTGVAQGQPMGENTAVGAAEPEPAAKPSASSHSGAAGGTGTGQ